MSRTDRVHKQLQQMEVDLATKSVGYLPSRILTTHIRNARRVAKRNMKYTLGKASEKQKIDAAMSMLLAHAARMDAISAGWRGGAAGVRGGLMVVQRR